MQLPALTQQQSLLPHYAQYLSALAKTSFQGQVCTDLASRLLMATDNSIYQILPQAVLYPKNSSDIQVILQLSQQPEFKDIRFSPRGGGTGTNGQSLTPGIMIDCSRHMHHILEINAAEQWVRVQPGVVLDQLNDALSAEGLFFAPSLSPSNRATLGGMFNTDACGLGSCCYGRTSQHVLEVSCVLSDGTAWQSLSLDMARLAECKHIPGIVGKIHHCVDEMVNTHQQEIDHRFPKLPRHMTGYNLAKVYDTDRQHFSLNYLLSGSEGTLAFITELKLNLLPKPAHQTLFAIKYASFDDALRAARDLLPTQPTAIETIDDKIWQAAKQDEIYFSVQAILDPEQNDSQTKAINFVQFSGNDQAEIDQKCDALIQTLKEAIQCQRVVGYHQTSSLEHIKALWNLRKKSVGLLANVPGQSKPWPFVEDTAVPPEKLADYIVEFRAVLESFGLAYGMFGHVDAGCLHVRPALDMTKAHDRQLVPIITQKINVLVKKYGGVLWAEHGRGFRTEYTEDYFGPLLMAAMRRIKTAFDPLDKLNPGKIATALEDHVSPVRVESPTRGEQEQQIDTSTRNHFQALMHCNGNGQCFDYHVDHIICPSAKVTRNRIHSPKGRSAIMREWLRLLAKTDYNIAQYPQEKGRAKLEPNDFSVEVHQAMSGCLGCKACASSCPVHVDIPHVKAQFLAHYHSRYRRPWRDYLIKHAESIAYKQSRLPRWLNLLFTQTIGNFVATKMGLVGLPKPDSNKRWKNLRRQATYQPTSRSQLTPENTVCLIPDALSTGYHKQVLVDFYHLASGLGYQVILLPFRLNGKAHHAKGFLTEFEDIVQSNQKFYQPLIEQGIPLVSIEPSTALCFRDEHAKVLGKPLPIQLPQEWLMNVMTKQPKHAKTTSPVYRLFSHCSEKSLLPQGDKMWQTVFEHYGLTLEIIQTGCCGMAGSYGHEVEHQAESKQLFEQSWQPKLTAEHCLATGFSCRCQARRFANIGLRHPVTVLSGLNIKS